MNPSKIILTLAIALFIGISATTAQIGHLGNQAITLTNYNPPPQQYSNIQSNASLSNINIAQGNQFENNANKADNNPQVNDNNDNNPQQMQSPAAPANQTIEPTLSNGFHIRFNLDEPSTSDKQTTSARTVSYKSSKSKSTSHSSFKVKRRFKHLLPHSKGKYKTSLCYNF